LYPQNFIFFSGGKDSLVMTHYLLNNCKIDGEVIFIDTGIAFPKTIEYVKSTANKYEWKLRIVKTKYDYFEWLKKYGFPNPIWRWCMRLLKMSVVQEIAKQNKGSNFYLGIRLHESIKRLKIYDDSQSKFFNKRLKVWIHFPIFHWSDEDIEKYIRYHNLPINPAYEELGFAGDCLCLAFVTKNQLFRIKEKCPKFWRRIIEARNELANKGDVRKYTLRGFLDPLTIERQSCLCMFELIKTT